MMAGKAFYSRQTRRFLINTVASGGHSRATVMCFAMFYIHVLRVAAVL